MKDKMTFIVISISYVSKFTYKGQRTHGNAVHLPV